MLFELIVTSWCNYRCTYCVVPVHTHRADSEHAFDHHPVESWIAAFARVPHDFALLVRGGEPFLDHANFARLLREVGALPRLKYLRVDTNGSWDPRLYESIPPEVRGLVQLNMSFHPTQVTFERFTERFARIREAGWHVGMVNYVLEANQAEDYERVRDHFASAHGIYVNPNPDAYDPAWEGGDQALLRTARRELEPLLPPLDLLRKTRAATRGKPCFFPSIAYFIAPNGMAQRACGVTVPGTSKTLDFVARSAEVLPLETSVSCPLPSCACLDRYAFLEEVPDRGQSLNLLAEYVGACTAHQGAAARRRETLWGRVASLFGSPPKPGRRTLPLAPAERQPPGTPK